MVDDVSNNATESRCDWGQGPTDYMDYHDLEWGIPQLTDGASDGSVEFDPAMFERVLFEKLCLEGFQSGLSWLTILRKRPAFREVFANFDAETVAAYTEEDVLALLQDSRIVRHRGKITATINNAQATLDLYSSGRTLAELMWSHKPTSHTPRTTISEVPATTDESKALAKELKRLGFKFVGPTTAYAAMQAMGVVNDHLTSCFCYETAQIAQQGATTAIKGLKSS